MDPQQLVPQLTNKAVKKELMKQRDRELAKERNKFPISEDFEDNLQGSKTKAYKRAKEIDSEKKNTKSQ